MILVPVIPPSATSKKLPLGYLKTDQSCVRDLLTDPSDAVLAQTIIGLAYSMNIGVIAEGVETEEQRHRLFDYGCNTYQGYLFGRPLPVDQLVFDTVIRNDASATVSGADMASDE